MNYTQLTEKNKVEIDILLKQGMSMRQVGSILGVSHSTISRYTVMELTDGWFESALSDSKLIFSYKTDP